MSDRAARASLSHAEYRAVWGSLSEAQRDRVREKAKWERMSLWAVLNEWPSLRGEEC